MGRVARCGREPRPPSRWRQSSRDEGTRAASARVGSCEKAESREIGCRGARARAQEAPRAEGAAPAGGPARAPAARARVRRPRRRAGRCSAGGRRRQRPPDRSGRHHRPALLRLGGAIWMVQRRRRYEEKPGSGPEAFGWRPRGRRVGRRRLPAPAMLAVVAMPVRIPRERKAHDPAVPGIDICWNWLKQCLSAGHLFLIQTNRKLET